MTQATQPEWVPIKELARVLYGRPTWTGLLHLTDDISLYSQYIQVLNAAPVKRLQESGDIEVTIIPTRRFRRGRKGPKYYSVKLTVYNGDNGVAITLMNTPKPFDVYDWTGMVQINAGRGRTLNVSFLAFLSICKRHGVIDYAYITTAVGGTKMVSFGDDQLVPAGKVCWKAIYAGAKPEWFTELEPENGVIRATRNDLAQAV